MGLPVCEIEHFKPAAAQEFNAKTYTQSFSINYEFPVCFTRNVFSPSNRVLRDVVAGSRGAARPRVAFFLDNGLEREIPDLAARIADYCHAFPDTFELAGPVETLTGGEVCKNDAGLVERLQRRLVEMGMDRHSYVVGVGGGALLDLVGYVAATTHRGVRHVRIPTTVLAQNDSGVGVKNGVNSFGVKNLLGTFQPPAAVINDSAFIDVLADRDKRAGMAEAVKVALIRDDKFFEWLDEHAEELAEFAAEPLDKLIRHCALLHMRQIATGGDPFERGSARPLDFGHWAAHKLEVLSNYELRHGEAVAIGIALDTHYSVLAGFLPEADGIRTVRLLEKLGFALWHDACDHCDPAGRHMLLKGLEEFREHLGGELTITLLAGLGVGFEVSTMRDDLIAQSIDWLRETASG